MKFDNKKFESGTAKCSICGHQWKAKAPINRVQNLECPNCHHMSGDFDQAYLTEA